MGGGGAIDLAPSASALERVFAIETELQNPEVGNLQTILEQLDQRTGARDRHILMDQRIRHEFTNRNRREQRRLGPERLVDAFSSWKQSVDVTTRPSKPLA